MMGSLFVKQISRLIRGSPDANRVRSRNPEAASLDIAGHMELLEVAAIRATEQIRGR